MNDLERRFHREMVQIYEKAKRETGYNATRFLQMVSTEGGLATARKLLRAPAASEGFTALWERQRLDLSVEALVLPRSSSTCSTTTTASEPPSGCGSTATHVTASGRRAGPERPLTVEPAPTLIRCLTRRCWRRCVAPPPACWTSSA